MERPGNASTHSGLGIGSKPDTHRSGLPFSGLGFDLSSVPGATLVVVHEKPLKKTRPAPLVDTHFPAGKLLNVHLGREIRGR